MKRSCRLFCSRQLVWSLCSLVLSALLLTTSSHGQEKIPVVLDADTANEVDDPFALARAVVEPSWQVLALNATQWQASQWTVPQSMESSHRLNQALLGHLGMSVKTRRGGTARLYDWGDQAQHSAAAYEIIHQAKRLPGGKKLTVVAMGALTNVASALLIDPSIESRLRLYWLGTTYDFEAAVMKKLDFNCVMDVQAVEVVLMSAVETHIMPINVAAEFTFDYDATKQQLYDKHSLGKFLCDRWYEHTDGSRKERILWDLALVEAMVHPEWCEAVKVTTSKENGNRQINYYRSLDADRMKADFFKQVNQYMAK